MSPSRKHSREEILDAAVATAFDGGLSQLSFGRVARRLGIADRTVVYYFPTIGDLVANVVVVLGLQLQALLEPAFTDGAAEPLELVRRAWPTLAHADVDPTFALFFEANGLAAAGRAPYDAIVPQLVEGWIDWAAGFFTSPESQRRTDAEAAIALIDGLLLLRQLAGPDAATRAATRLTITD
ncbi:MAG: TetR/AcrR family transcriptional regulator [Ilumatobacter sp.]|nr:TetR/AcrR family transcriptional regulator [Ilumatobacter sp.]